MPMPVPVSIPEGSRSHMQLSVIGEDVGRTCLQRWTGYRKTQELEWYPVLAGPLQSLGLKRLLEGLLEPRVTQSLGKGLPERSCYLRLNDTFSLR